MENLRKHHKGQHTSIMKEYEYHVALDKWEMPYVLMCSQVNDCSFTINNDTDMSVC